MLRRFAAAALLLAGAVIANVGLVAWWFDREVTEPARIREMAASILREPAVREDLAPLLFDDVAAELGLGVADSELVAQAVEQALLDPLFVDAYADVLEGFYRAMFEDGGAAAVTIDAAGIEQAAFDHLTTFDPSLAAELGTVGLPDTIVLPVEDLPDLTAAEDALALGWRVAVGLGSALLLSGIIIHPRTAVGFRRSGLLFLLLAGVQALGVWLVTDLAAPGIPVEGFDALAEVGAEIVLAGLTAQAIVQAVIAAGVAVLAHLSIWLPRLTAPLRAVTATLGS
jgi:hypothetical protein